MANWSIARQIRAIYGMALIMVTLGTVTGVAATAFLGQVFRDFSDTVATAQAADAMNDAVARARVAALRYRVAPSDQLVDEFNQSIDEAMRLLESLGAGSAPPAGHDAAAGAGAASSHLPPEGMRAAAQIGDRLEDYRSTFRKLNVLNAARDTFVLGMNEAGEKAEAALRDVMQAAQRAGDTTGVYQAAMSLGLMQEGRLEMREYFRTGDRADLEASHGKLTESKREISRLSERSVQPGQKRKAMLARTEIGSYSEASQQIFSTNEQRVTLAARLDELGPSIEAQLTRIRNDTVASQGELADWGVTAGYATVLLLVAAAVLACLCLALFGRRASRTIAAAIARSVSEMGRLANGDYEAEISNLDNDSELGEIARALEAFRQKGLEARRLEAEMRRKEAETAAEREAQRDREKRLEAERRSALEDERRRIMADLSAGLGAVVEAAARGDFTRRIDMAFGDDDLDRIVGSINSLVANVEHGIGETARTLHRIAQGDLTARMDGKFDGIFAELEAALSKTATALGELITEISRQCDDIGATSDEMLRQAHDLASRAERQASALEETAAAMEELSATARSSAEAAHHSSGIARAATEKADEAGQVVAAAVAAMTDIRAASDKIRDIVSVIDGIAFQTNLLALNASVEAARAGTAGKGFAVVATEVRALAQRSGEASKDIKGLIEETAAQVTHGVELVEKTGETLNQVVGNVRAMAETMDGLTATAQEQAGGVGEVTGTVTRMDTITQKNAALAEASRAAARLLDEKVSLMRELLGRFHAGPVGGRDSTLVAAE